MQECNPNPSTFDGELGQSLTWQLRTATPPIEIEPATTPPIVSSSPYCDAMDISPLPHKLPLTFQVTLPSPTPELTPEDVHEISPDLLQPDGLSEPPPSFLALPE